MSKSAEVVKIKCSTICEAEKRYAFDFVFEWVLGISYSLDFCDSENIVLEFEGFTITTPETFFSQADENWLHPVGEDISQGVLSVKDRRFGDTEDIPIFVYSKNDRASLSSENLLVASESQTDFNFDLFGQIFFLLTRYEECYASSSDPHSRFPVGESLLFDKKRYLRPLVNEYIEIFKLAILNHAPVFSFKHQQFRQILSCDVDYLRFPHTQGIFGALLFLGSQMSKRQPVRSIAKDAVDIIQSRLKGYERDRFNTFETLEGIARSNNVPLIYFLMSKTGKNRMDGNYHVGDPDLWHSLGRSSKSLVIDVGLHGSYDSFLDEALLSTEKSALQSALEKQNRNPKIYRCRQHYLRWSALETPRVQSLAGFIEDYTLGFPETGGFRSSCCIPHPLYDLSARQTLPIVEHPLTIMDGTLLNPKYLDLKSVEEVVGYASDLKDTCRKHNGEYNLLWHNSSLSTDFEIDCLRRIVEH